MRLSQPRIRLLVLILWEEYFRSPPGGPSPVRSIATSLLQGLWTHQEATGVVITPALHNPTVIIPTLHDPAGVTMIAIRLSLSLRKKCPGNLGQLRVDEGRALLLLDIEIHPLLHLSEAQSVPQNDQRSVLELVLPSILHPPRALAHILHTLFCLYRVPLDMNLLRATTATTTTTTTLLADDLEDP